MMPKNEFGELGLEADDWDCEQKFNRDNRPDVKIPF
jgi:hypothetical protein